MALQRSQRVRRTDARAEQLPIGPEEYFVLTRVDGKPTIGELVATSGLPADRAEAILDRLIELGALATIDGGEPARAAARPAPSTDATELRHRADARKRSLLQHGLDSGASRPTRPQPHESATPSALVVAEPAPAPKPSLPLMMPQVAADDPRLDPSCGVPLEDQRILLALDDRFEELTPFDVLGLRPTDDEREIKRAYFDASRRLHPDAYFGRRIDRFQPLLLKLFARAKQAYAELRRPEVRRPYVAVVEEEARHVEAMRRAERERVEAEAQAQRDAERAEVERRRVERLEERARAQEQRLRATLDRQVEEHVRDATAAREAGNLASAANHLRLALQADPHNEAIRVQWEETRSVARKERAKVAFSRGLQFAEYGQTHEAIPLLCEAADADPTAEHLAHAAQALAGAEPVRARGYAMRALEGLTAMMHTGAPGIDAAKAAAMRLMIARAFMAAGQHKTALEQVQLAQVVRPDDPEVRALLKSLKVT